jgi:hypothetical protein
MNDGPTKGRRAAIPERMIAICGGIKAAQDCAKTADEPMNKLLSNES